MPNASLQDLKLILMEQMQNLTDPETDAEGNPVAITKETLDKIKALTGLASNVVGITKLQLQAARMLGVHDNKAVGKALFGADIDVDGDKKPTKQLRGKVEQA